MLPNMDLSRTDNYHDYYGPTATPHMSPRRRSPHSSCLESIYNIQTAFFPRSKLEPTTTDGYQEELIRTLTSAHTLAAENIYVAQTKHKKYHDKHAKRVLYSIGEWILI